MAANADAMVREAIKAYRSNKKAEARTLLEKATELDQYNEQAWIWLSAVVDSPEDQRTCLENVLYINPDNANAKQGLRMLTAKTGDSASSGKTGTLEKPPSPPLAESFSSTPPTATSSASAIYNPANDVSPAQLDDWVAGLQLKGTKPDVNEGVEEELEDDAFANVFSGAFDDDDDTDGEEDDDPFNRLDDMFSGVTPPSKTSARPSTTAGPFSSDNFDFDDLDSDDDDDVFSGLDLPQKPPAAAPTPSRTSPGRENAASSAAKLSSQSTKKSAMPTKSPMPKTTSSPAKSSSSSYGKETSKSIEMDAAEYFREIPPEIKATRLPGMDENYPTLVIVGLALLIMLNLGAAAFLILNLAG